MVLINYLTLLLNFPINKKNYADGVLFTYVYIEDIHKEPHQFAAIHAINGYPEKIQLYTSTGDGMPRPQIRSLKRRNP